MSIITLDEAKDELNIAASNLDHDTELQRYVDGITGVVEEYKHEVVEKRRITERLRLHGRPRFRLWRVPVISLDSMTNRADSTAVDISGFDVDGDTGLVEVLSGGPPSGLFTVTYTAGYTTVPQHYVQGALVILHHVWETQRGAGAVGGGVIGAEETYNPALSYSIPRKALEWLGPPRPVVA